MSRGGNNTGGSQSDPSSNCIGSSTENLYSRTTAFKDFILTGYEAAGADPWLEGGPDPRLAKTGEGCTEGADCRSNICLEDASQNNAKVCVDDCSTAACPDGTTCQQLNTPDLTLRGVVCAPPADRNRTCAAVFDEDACTVGDCIPTDIELNDDNTLKAINAQGCRVACDATGDGAECLDDEACIRGGRFGFGGDFEKQLVGGEPVSCVDTACSDDDDETFCACTGDSFCVEFDDGDFCGQIIGMCAVPVRPPFNVDEVDVDRDNRL